MKSPKRESPIRRANLASPGESLEDELFELLFGKLFVLVLGALGTLSWALIEWWRWYSNSPPSPLPATVFATLFCSYVVFRVGSKWGEIRNLRMGRDGEIAVGQLLERKAKLFNGYAFHDVVMREGGTVLGNIDHIMICDRGILAIETKTWRRSPGDKIQFDGNAIKLNSHPLDKDPARQATANARWLKELLKELTGRDVNVRPVVIFPGAFIDDSARKKAIRDAENLWVINAKGLTAFLENETTRLSPEDKEFFSNQLFRDLQRQRQRQRAS